MSVKMTVLRQELMRDLRGLLGRIENPKAAMREIAVLLQESIRTNFRQGGRPAKWSVSKRAAAQSGQTLRDTGRLMNSITSRSTKSRAIAGTNVVYAAAQNFGIHKVVSQQVTAHSRLMTKAFGKAIDPRMVSVKAHNRQMQMNIEARPFMEIQDEDWQDAKDILMKHLIRGNR